MGVFDLKERNTDVYESEKTTTLVIDQVPSKVAMDILNRSIETGIGLTNDELKSRVEARLNGSDIVHVNYATFISYINSHPVFDDEITEYLNMAYPLPDKKDPNHK